MVDRVSFRLEKGRSLALVGESGSGKTVTAQAIVRLLPQPAASYPTGEILFRGRDVLKMSDGELREMRGAAVTMVFQEPMTSLNPLHTIERQIGEIIALHHGRAAATKGRVVELLAEVGIADPAERLGAYPHQLSGGQRQRVMIAMALANRPDLLIADEPTTALDVTVQAQILKLLKDLQAKFGMALLFITHDLNVVRRIADDVIVMQQGRIVEAGPVADVFAYPRHPYTKALLAAEPKGEAPHERQERADDRQRRQSARSGFRSGAASFDAPSGTSRRSTACRSRCARARPSASSASSARERRRSAMRCCGSSARRARSPIAGVRFKGLNARAMRPLRRDMQVVFQDPFGSLSPRMSVAEIVEEGLIAQRDEAQRGRASAHRRAGARRHRARSRHARPLSARVLRRAAPAHRHRPGHGA